MRSGTFGKSLKMEPFEAAAIAVCRRFTIAKALVVAPARWVA
jgi:hypothetical protein